MDVRKRSFSDFPGGGLGWSLIRQRLAKLPLGRLGIALMQPDLPKRRGRWIEQPPASRSAPSSAGAAPAQSCPCGSAQSQRDDQAPPERYLARPCIAGRPNRRRGQLLAQRFSTPAVSRVLVFYPLTRGCQRGNNQTTLNHGGYIPRPLGRPFFGLREPNTPPLGAVKFIQALSGNANPAYNIYKILWNRQCYCYMCMLQ